MSRGGIFRSKLWENLGTAIVALGLALVVWVSAVYQTDKPREGFFGDPIPIEVLNAPDGLLAINSPDAYVRVRIRAFASSWSSLTASSFRATADWTGLREGLYTVPIRVHCSDKTVTIVSTQPEMVYVELERVRREAMRVEVELRDRDELPLGYAVGEPEAEPRVVSVEGPSSAVARVNSLIASVSLAGQRAASQRVVELHPEDKEGKRVTGVRLTPEIVTVRLDIERSFNYREVAVRARTRGHPARGYFVSSVEVSPATATVVGPPAVIARMPGLVSVMGEVDVTGATRMLAERMELDLPEGVSVLTEDESETHSVLVTVGIAPVMGGTTVEVPLKATRLRAGLMVDLSVPTVDVILTGPAVLLDDLEIDLLDARVDLSGLGVGTHQVRALVSVAVDRNPKLVDLVVTSISPEYVEAKIAQIPTPTPTFTLTPLPTATFTATPPPTPTFTPTLSIEMTATVTITLEAQGTITPTSPVTVTASLTPTNGTPYP